MKETLVNFPSLSAWLKYSHTPVKCSYHHHALWGRISILQTFRYCYDFLTLDFLQKFCTPWVDVTHPHLRSDQQILPSIQRSAVPLINHTYMNVNYVFSLNLHSRLISSALCQTICILMKATCMRKAPINRSLMFQLFKHRLIFILGTETPGCMRTSIYETFSLQNPWCDNVTVSYTHTHMYQCSSWRVSPPSKVALFS